MTTFFISHMVQMKDRLKKLLHGMQKLYIPHGSDERREDVEKPLWQALFISHMVQMKARRVKAAQEAALAFISHMVQMKACNT